MMIAVGAGYLEMKVLFISLFLIDVLNGSYSGYRRPTPKSSTITKDICTDTVVEECEDPVVTVNTVRRCYMDPGLLSGSEVKVCKDFDEKTSHQTCHKVLKTNCQLQVGEPDYNYMESERLAVSDLVSKTKAHAQALIGVLEEFKSDPKAVDWVKQNLQGSTCIGSFDDAIAATRAGLGMITRSESDLTVFMNTFSKLKDQEDTVALMRGIADMLLQIESLIPKLTPITIASCEVKPQDNLQGMKELTDLLVKIAASNDVAFSQSEVRAIIERTAQFIESATTFLIELQEVFRRASLCNSDPESSVLALGDIFDKVAIFLDSLGSDNDTNEIRQKNNKFTTSLATSVEQLTDLDFSILDCSSNQIFGYTTAAKSFLDLANFIEEVGEEELAAQLGISFDLEYNEGNNVVLGAGSHLKSKTLTASHILSLGKAQVQYLLDILETFKADPKFVDWVTLNLQGSSCIGSLDDTIAAIRAGLDMLTTSEADIIVFLNTFTELEDKKDPVVLMRSTAELLMQMDSLLPRLTTTPANTPCRVKPQDTLQGMKELTDTQDTLQGMKELTDMLVTLAVGNSVAFSKPGVRATVERAAVMNEATTTLLVELEKVFERTSSYCDAGSGVDAVLALGEIFDKVATFLVHIGSDYDPTEIRRKNVKFTNAMATSVAKLREFDFELLDCASAENQEQGYKKTAENQEQGYKKSAEALLNLANLVEEIGEEELATQLGISFDLDF